MPDPAVCTAVCDSQQHPQLLDAWSEYYSCAFAHAVVAPQQAATHAAMQRSSSADGPKSVQAQECQLSAFLRLCGAEQVAEALLQLQAAHKLPALLTQALRGGLVALCVEVAWLLAHVSHAPDVVNRLCSPQLVASLQALLGHALQQVA